MTGGRERARRIGTTLVLATALTAGSRPLLGQVADERGTTTAFGLAVSVDYMATRDGLITPRVHHGAGVSRNGFFVAFETRRSAHRIEAWFGNVDVGAGEGFTYRRAGGVAHTPRGTTERGDASYSFLRRLGDRPLWLGVSLSLQATHTTYRLAAGAAEGFLYLAALGLDGRRDVRLSSRSSLAFSVRLPLLGWRARPTWSTVDEARLQASHDFFHRMSRGTLVGPAEVQGVSAAAAYRHDLTGRFSLHGALSGSWVRDGGEGRFVGLRVGLETGISVRRGKGGAR